MKNGGERESFILYKNFYEPISQLTDEQLGRLFRCIYKWQIHGKADPEKDISMAFGFFVNQFRIDNEKYLEKCETLRNNASKGGLAKATKSKQKVANRALNDNDNDNVNDNDNEKNKFKVRKTLTLPFEEPSFVDAWNKLTAQPKWRKRSKDSLSLTLDSLAKFDVEFAVKLIYRTIEHDYPAVVYDEDITKYEDWLRNRHSDNTTHNGSLCNLTHL